MNEAHPIVVPHGGYKELLVYAKSDVIYRGTVLFCARFLPPRGDRTVDQMVQAARSCKQNIAEGSAASGTSKETEIKLTNVARATLDELMEDYRDWLKVHDQEEWGLTHPSRDRARKYARNHNSWIDWEHFFQTLDAEKLANIMLTICAQTKYLLDRMIARQEKDFVALGGVRERMHAARVHARGENWSSVIYSRLEDATSAEELRLRVTELRNQIERNARALRQKRGW